MAEQHVNKVVYGGKVLIDLTADTVDATTLSLGSTAHDKSGAAITGTDTRDRGCHGPERDGAVICDGGRERLHRR